MKIIITGMSGFVGQWLKAECEQHGHIVKGVSFRNIDFTNKDELYCAFVDFEPDVIFHLAAQSSPHISWKEPYSTILDNIVSAVNIMALTEELGCKLVIAGSAEVYETQLTPLSESSELKPRNPYGASKLLIDHMVRIIGSDRKINVTLLRLFNHIGPKQSENFVVSTFAKQLAEIKLGIKDPVISVGNLTAKRDMLDVRDAVRAYLLVAEREEFGEFYNVCSGKSYEISDILNRLIDISGLQVEVVEDPNRMRPSDIPIFVGSYNKINEIGWTPTHSINDTLKDTYEWWLSELGR